MVQSASKSIDLIDEDYASVWRFPSILEELSDSFRSNPNKHFLKLRSNHLYEAASRLISQGPRKQRLPRSWRSIKHDSPPNPCSHRLIFLRMMQEIYNLLKLLLDFLPSIEITKHGPSCVPLRLELSIRQRRLIDLPNHILERQHRNRTSCSNPQQLITNQRLMYRKRYLRLTTLTQVLLEKLEELFE